jgi:uncharacterized protein with GYD domain
MRSGPRIGMGLPSVTEVNFGVLGFTRHRESRWTADGSSGLLDPFSGEGDLPMALYMYQAAYTAESVAAQIKEPQDRIEAVKPALEALGGKILVGGYPFGDYDVLAVYEAPDDTAAAAFALAIAAGGAVKSAKTTRLLTGQEWMESLRNAQGSQYRPAR